MFFEENDIRECLRCPSCKSTLVDPRIMPCCEKSVCLSCADIMRQCSNIKNENIHSDHNNNNNSSNNSNNVNTYLTAYFACSLCSANVQADQPLVRNLAVQQMLTMQPKVVSRGKQAAQLQRHLDELSAQLEQMESVLWKGNTTIMAYCSRIRNQVDVAFERVVRSVEEHRDNFLFSIDHYETDTKNKYHETFSSSETVEYRSLIESARNNMKTWSTYLSDSVIDDSTVEASIAECRQLKERAARGYRRFYNSFFCNRFLRFHVNSQPLIKSDILGLLDVFSESQYCARISGVSCVETFAGNSNSLHFEFGYLSATTEEDVANADYHNDSLAFAGDLDDSSISIWSIGRNELIGKLRGHTQFARKPTLVANDRLLTCSDDTTLKLWDLRTFECVRTFSGHREEVTSVELIDADTFVSCSSDMTLRVWKMDRTACVHVLHGHEAAIQGLKLLRRHQWLSSGNKKQPPQQLISFDYQPCLKFWCLETNVCVRTRLFSQVISAIELLGDTSGETTTAAISFVDYSIQIWNLDQMELVTKLIGHENEVLCMRQINDRFLLAGSCDCTLKVWNLETAQCDVTLAEQHTNQICLLRILTEDLFLSCSADKVTKIWRINQM